MSCRNVCAVLLLIATAPAYSGQAEDDGTSSAPPAVTGIARGSLNPAKHGLTLPNKPKVMLIPVSDEETTYDGYIDPWQAHFIERRLHRAEQEKYDLVILQIHTNGGLVDSCEEINNAIKNCKVPVVAFVQNKALSGGAIISLGCKAIVMTPTSRIGAAKAVIPGMDVGKDMRQKLDSNMRALAISYCEQNGYPCPIAIAMVDSEVKLLETSDPKNRFMLGESYDVMAVKPAVTKIWKDKDQILTLTATQAVDAGLASGIAADESEIYSGLNIAPSLIEEATITPAEKAARFLSHPLWRVALALIGVIALLWEMKSPGHGVGYITFAFCLGLFFWLQIFSANAGLAELVMFGVGAAIVAMEVFVLPTFGIGLIAGFGLIIVSIVLSFVPERVSLWRAIQGGASSGDLQLLKEAFMWGTITMMTLVAAAITGLLRGAKLPGLSRLALQTENRGTTTSEGVAAALADVASSATGSASELVGQRGQAETVLRPAGKVRIDGSTYDAVSEGGFIDAGSEVVVLRIAAGTPVVRAVQQKVPGS
ncbi:MAG TPA: NfeD family protein [Planctomycetota bacterium]|jgi:membrane-bound serine protease (ClpP class)